MILCLLSIKAGCLGDLAQPAKAKLFNMNLSPTCRLNQRAGCCEHLHGTVYIGVRGEVPSAAPRIREWASVK